MPTADPLAADLQSALENPYSDLPPAGEPTDSPMDDAPPRMQDRLKRYVALEKRRRVVEEELERVKADSDVLAKLLLEDFAEAQASSFVCDGLTIYRRTDHYVSKKTGVATSVICAKLAEIGRPDMVEAGYAPAAMKSYVLEQLSQLKELDGEIVTLSKDGGKPPMELVAQRADVARILDLIPLLNVGQNMRIVSRK